VQKCGETINHSGMLYGLVNYGYINLKYSRTLDMATG